MNVKKNRLTTILIILLVFISIGYAFLTGVLKINTSLSLNKVTFDIRFDNVTPGSHNCNVIEDAHISDDKNREISFEVSLNHLKDYYKFTTDVINDSDVPVRIKTIELTGITDSQKKLINYRVYYTDSGEDLKERDFVKPNTTTNITMEIEYYLDQSLEVSDLPTNNLSLDCMFTLTFESVDLNEFNSRKIVQVITKDAEFFPTNLIDFTKSTYADEHEGLQMLDSTKNDEYPIYYYRGGNSKVHNYVLFANKCWRIIRTTNEGAVKMLFSGVPNNAGSCDVSGINTYAYNHRYHNNSWNWVGSDMKISLNTWFFENLNGYQSYLYDTAFCNDNQYINGRIDLTCDAEHEVSIANGKNDYPIALLTAEEANLCGYSTNESSYPWMWVGRSEGYWMMTGCSTRNNYGWFVYGSKLSDGVSPNYNIGQSWGVRPVVALNKDVVINDGDGTASNPYIVALS